MTEPCPYCGETLFEDEEELQLRALQKKEENDLEYSPPKPSVSSYKL